MEEARRGPVFQDRMMGLHTHARTHTQGAGLAQAA
jgi:hypothetical protein